MLQVPYQLGICQSSTLTNHFIVSDITTKLIGQIAQPTEFKVTSDLQSHAHAQDDIQVKGSSGGTPLFIFYYT